ncbi:MAG: MarR family winged helix-turn-helix transcriptional regulator [Pseudomonadota bacterium]
MPQKNKNKVATGGAREHDYRNDCIAFNLRRTTRIVTRRYEELMRPAGVTAFQFGALAALMSRPALPQLAFVDVFGMDASTVNRNIRTMAGKGLVRYTDDLRDSRKKHVAITAKGRRAFEKAAPYWEQAQAETQKMMTAFDWGHERAWLDAISKGAS